MYLSSTEPKTKFTKDSAVQTIILAGSYLGAMLLAGNKIPDLQASPVNPTVAFAILLFNSTGAGWGSTWIFMVFPLVGSILATIFFKKIY